MAISCSKIPKTYKHKIKDLKTYNPKNNSLILNNKKSNILKINHHKIINPKRSNRFIKVRTRIKLIIILHQSHLGV